MTAFGIGCFHFGLREVPDGKITAGEYIKILRTSLESIKSISSINIEYNSSPEDFFNAPDTNSGLGRGGICFPYLDFFELSFEIYIPKRVQAEIMDCPEDFVDTTTERFRFKLINNYDLPISFVECIDAKKDSQPSGAVMVLREYLDNELQTQAAQIRIETLGPSPFHANFFLMAVQGENQRTSERRSPFHCSQEHQEGYDRITFSYSVNFFESEEEAKEELFQKIDTELDLFYQIVQNKSRKMCEWAEIEEKLSSLLELQKDRSGLGRFKRMIKRGTAIDDLVCLLCQFSGKNSFEDGSLKKSHGECYKTDVHFLKNYVDEGMKENQNYPITEISELIKFAEKRHNKAWENFVVLIAAIIGGIVGSLVTACAGHWMPSETSQGSGQHTTNQPAITSPATNLLTASNIKTNSLSQTVK